MFILVNKENHNIVGKYDTRPLSASDNVDIVEVATLPDNCWQYTFVNNAFTPRTPSEDYIKSQRIKEIQNQLKVKRDWLQNIYQTKVMQYLRDIRLNRVSTIDIQSLDNQADTFNAEVLLLNAELEEIIHPTPVPTGPYTFKFSWVPEAVKAEFTSAICLKVDNKPKDLNDWDVEFENDGLSNPGYKGEIPTTGTTLYFFDCVGSIMVNGIQVYEYSGQVSYEKPVTVELTQDSIIEIGNVEKVS